MRKRVKESLAFRTVGIQLTKNEMAILEKASAIAEEARELARRLVGPDFDQDDTDLWLAEIEHNAAAFAVDGFIEVSEADRIFV